jgi:hypothetical protein
MGPTGIASDFPLWANYELASKERSQQYSFQNPPNPPLRKGGYRELDHKSPPFIKGDLGGFSPLPLLPFGPLHQYSS